MAQQYWRKSPHRKKRWVWTRSKTYKALFYIMFLSNVYYFGNKYKEDGKRVYTKVERCAVEIYSGEYKKWKYDIR